MWEPIFLVYLHENRGETETNRSIEEHDLHTSEAKIFWGPFLCPSHVTTVKKTKKANTLKNIKKKGSLKASTYRSHTSNKIVWKSKSWHIYGLGELLALLVVIDLI